MNRVRAVSLIVLGLIVAGCAVPRFTHDVEGEGKPWTHSDFRDNPDSFHFAILGDRTGGHREGVFPEAARKLNLLQPAFVMSVGDLIEGYIEDQAELRSQWQEFDGFLEALDMPFFHVPGNHDVTNETMVKVWEERYGKRHYSFVYNDVLFLCLDSQDGPRPEGSRNTVRGLSQRQVSWAKGVLQRHPDVRWTCVFMHQPLWLYEERGAADTGKIRAQGFHTIEQVLQARPYTVFAGHWHSFTKYRRHGRDYFILATTGAASALRGPSFGQFDHATWVTMTPQGPKLAILLIDGIFPDSVHTEVHDAFRGQLKFDVKGMARMEDGIALSLPLKNTWDHPLHCRLEWDVDETSPWTVMPRSAEVEIAPGEEAKISFEATCKGKFLPAPRCVGEFSAGDQLSLSSDVDVPVVNAFLKANRPTTRAGRVDHAPVVDGRLDDGIWQRPPDAQEFIEMNTLGKPSVPTVCWVAHDDQNLYVALRCTEPRMDRLKVDAKDRDGQVWTDDAVEVFVDTNRDRKTYYHFIVNAAGVVLDANGRDTAYNANLQVATAVEPEAWTVELAIPWTELNLAALPNSKLMGLQLVRHRAQTDEILQFPPVNGPNHRPAFFGDLELSD